MHDDVQTNHHGPAELTSASFVPDWMLGTHVWRTEDAMALFNIPQQFYAYYSNIINHCMRTSSTCPQDSRTMPHKSLLITKQI
jgi:hypothetical protein